MPPAKIRAKGEEKGAECGLKQSDPDKKREAIVAWLAGIDADLIAVKSEAEWRTGLRVNLKNLTEIESMIDAVPENLKKDVGFIFAPVADGTAMIVVLDYEKRIRFVTTQDLEKWRLEKSEAIQQAVSNLWKMAENVKIEDLGKGIVRIHVEDSYDAATVLVPALRESVERSLRGQPVWAIPTREYLIACRSDDVEACVALKMKAKNLWEEGPYELSPHVFRMTEECQLLEI